MKNLFLLLFISGLLYASGSRAQTCTGNLLTNWSFSSGLNNGWSAFGSINSWTTSVHNGCIDTFIYMGATSSSGGGIAQNVSIASGKCYSLCICLAPQGSAQFTTIKAFAATNDPGVTYNSLRGNTFPTGTAVLIDSFNVNGTASPASYCRNSWTATTAYSRIIVLSEPQPPHLGGEVYLDNVCFKECASGITPPDVKDAINFTANGVHIGMDGKIFDLDLIDLSGKRILQVSQVSEYEIAANNIEHGIYILRISSQGIVTSRKVVF
jgi:hypothetical protein